MDLLIVEAAQAGGVEAETRGNAAGGRNDAAALRGPAGEDRV